MRKFYSIMLFAILYWGGLSAQSETKTPIIKKFVFNDAVSISNLSDNGLWGTAKGTNAENQTYDDNPYLLNVTEGTKAYLLTSAEISNSISSGAYDVTNDGSVVVGSYNHYPAYYKGGKWTTINPDAATYGTAIQITPDGKYIIGNYQNGYAEKPLMWELKNDAYVNIATTGMNLPKVNAAGKTAETNRFVGISADGNILLGCLDFIYPGAGGCCYYIYNRATDNYKMIGLDKLNLPDFVDMASLSNNGKWVTGTIYLAKDNTDYNYPYKYEVSTGEFTIYEESDAEDLGGFAINNNGTPFAATPYNNQGRILKYKYGNFWYTLQLMLYEKYGINFFTTTGFSYTGTPIAMSDDGKTMAGIAMATTDSYVITLPETFEEAAASVNLLAAYSVSPTVGATLSRVKTFSVLFDKEPDINESKITSIKFIDSAKDTIVQTAYSIKKDASNAKKYTIYFRSKTLTNGVKYTLVIPEGVFALAGTEMKNKEIKASYIGRDNIPVQMQMASPADNASVSELSYSSPLTLTYDVPLTLLGSPTGKLYQEGIEDPLCDLVLSVSSNYLTAYPAIKRNLYKDTKYKVVIPAGAVADILGECANKEVILNYMGIYERPLTDDNALFYEDFNNPNTSYNNVLIFDGDGNTPNDDMYNVGFATNSIGWHLLVRESTETDNYCAASTSMYTPAGKSNDWIATPQLYISNKYYSLTFKSQSYKKNKTDRLKVYLWTNDEVISVLSNELIDRFKSEGTLIYDETEVSGDSEENLANEWKNTKISLKDYSGKNIYIGFVNENKDQSMVFIDDIAVTYEGPFSIGSTTETIVSGVENIEVSGYVRNTSDQTYTSMKAYYFNDDKSVSEEISLTGLNLKKNDIQKFTFKTPLPTPSGKITNFTIGVEIDNAKQEIKYNAKNLAFIPNKRMVVEEGTGTWCGNCPMGFLALEYLEGVFGENVITVGVHSQDSYECTGYPAFMNYGGYPQGVINRLGIYNPMSSGDGYSFTSPTGDNTFADVILSEMENYTDADITLSNAVYDPDVNKISITTTVNYALDIESNNCNVFYVILEDGLTGNQTNYFYTDQYASHTIFGDWRAGEKYGTPYVSYTYNDVARAIIGESFNGLSGYIPASVTANTPVNFSIQNTIPSQVTDMSKASIVCLLTNAGTGRVINAAKARFTQGVVSIDNLSTEDHNISITTEGNDVNVQFNNNAKATIMLYDINGRIINQVSATVGSGESIAVDAKGYTGIAIARVVANNQTKVQKVILK